MGTNLAVIEPIMGGSTGRKRPVSAPAVPKKEKKEKPLARPVYLPKEKWEELDQVAKFEAAIFEMQGDAQPVSRNDVIVAHLDWSCREFWKDKGGRPETDAEFDEKVKRHVNRLARQKNSAKE